MNLLDLTRRETPHPWHEGDNIPWNDPDFSRRMLAEHLSQAHDGASRRFDKIDRGVRFLHETILKGQPGKILDLGCGPGLYLERFARLGYNCHGIDFSPASIEHARRSASDLGLAIEYTLGDVRTAPFGDGCDMVMFIYGEFNVFKPADARFILEKALKALKPGGSLVLEPSPEGHVRGLGSTPSIWSSSIAGLFSDHPHLLLEESFWDEDSRAATNRYYVVDAASGKVTQHASSYQAYSDAELRNLLTDSGFTGVRFFPNLTGEGERAPDFIVVEASKPPVKQGM